MKHALFRSPTLAVALFATLGVAAVTSACGPDNLEGLSTLVDGGSADASSEAGLGCVGITPPLEAYGKSPGPLSPQAGGAGGPSADPLTIGAPAPSYWLYDFQPQSCGFTATYGLPVFKGVVTLVGLWAGW